MIHVITNNSVMWETLQKIRLGLFQDSDFAGDLEDSKSTPGGRKIYVCSNQLDVQETNFSFAQFNRIRDHFQGWTVYPHLIYGI